MRTFRLRTAAPAAGLIAIQLAAGIAAAQQLDLPRPSPKAAVSQWVGVTEIEILYSSPGVKNRTVWGELVPYNQVWRTGANENTTITFSTPVRIQGKELPAGTYGLQTIPTPGEWTVIFSKDAELWGAFNYKPENDALRIQARPQAADFRERMIFTFDNVTDTTADVVLHWEKLKVPFTVEVDTPKLAMERIGQAVRWQTPYQAANYCLQNDTCLDDASRWLDASLALQENFTNLRAKAQLLAKRNDHKGAVSYGERALAAARSAQPPPNPQQVKDLEGQVAEWKKK
jgi:hypothetical protein